MIGMFPSDQTFPSTNPDFWGFPARAGENGSTTNALLAQLLADIRKTFSQVIFKHQEALRWHIEDISNVEQCVERDCFVYILRFDMPNIGWCPPYFFCEHLLRQPSKPAIVCYLQTRSGGSAPNALLS